MFFSNPLNNNKQKVKIRLAYTVKPHIYQTIWVGDATWGTSKLYCIEPPCQGNPPQCHIVSAVEMKSVSECVVFGKYCIRLMRSNLLASSRLNITLYIYNNDWRHSRIRTLRLSKRNMLRDYICVIWKSMTPHSSLPTTHPTVNQR